MSISYSTNKMGPINREWYQDRGLVKRVTRSVESGVTSNVIGGTQKRFDYIKCDVITEHWAGGRIDIRGLDISKYHEGRAEYSLPIMDFESWTRLTNWLNGYKTSELKTY